MRAIWKYPMPDPDHLVVEMPMGAKVLTVGMQKGVPTMWVMVDPDAPKEIRTFALAGTGHMLPDEWGDWSYLGTFHNVSNLGLVFHLFEPIS